MNELLIRTFERNVNHSNGVDNIIWQARLKALRFKLTVEDNQHISNKKFEHNLNIQKSLPSFIAIISILYFIDYSSLQEYLTDDYTLLWLLPIL